MFSERILWDRISVSNPITFAANKDKLLRAEIVKKFIGKCFAGAFITKLLNIVTSRDIRLLHDATGYIDVQFSVMAYEIHNWDIITNIEVINITRIVIGSAKIHSEPDYAPVNIAITVANPQIANLIQMGQRISVRVVKSAHDPMQDFINVVGVLFTYEPNSMMYKVTGNLNQTIIPKLTVLIDTIRAELNKRKNMTQEQFDRVLNFENLVYSYGPKNPKNKLTVGEIKSESKEFPAWVGILPIPEQDTKDINLLDMAEKFISGHTVQMDGIWCRTLDISRSSPLIRKMKEDEDNCIEENPSIVFIGYIKNILDFIVAIREMSEIYNTPELMQEHSNIWEIMKSGKKLID